MPSSDNTRPQTHEGHHVRVPAARVTGIHGTGGTMPLPPGETATLTDRAHDDGPGPLAQVRGRS
ncbi:hypothetical protein [Thermomonospora umbrina]|uniref:Uncharacterized protein n=1 Tax=Thermomonospora umbrina TaxID=111806 RepID=A0A3D9SQ58_9ACTN|nr:hypothetical protein [Thermomonospora umbrina]REE98079.1 hypothetical protein DFJ69_3560 [Thermomonospora umbrina]